MNFFSLFKRNLIYKFKNKIPIDDDNVKTHSLDELFHQYGSDKANLFIETQEKSHGYSVFYEKELKKFKNVNTNILEIGSYSGGSAAAFSKYLPKSNIFCFDINISNFKYKSKKIHVFGLDINDKNKVNKILNQILSNFSVKKFDIIIDDGSHNLSDILCGLKFFFKFLKKDGLYVIEDFKHPNYYGNNNDINHIFFDEFLKNIKNKKISNSNIISEKEQITIIDSIKNVETFRGNLENSDICFIEKN